MYLRRLRLLFEFEIRKHQKSKDQIISMLLNPTTLNKKTRLILILIVEISMKTGMFQSDMAARLKGLR